MSILDIPAVAWSRRLDEELPTAGRPSRPFGPLLVLRMLPVAGRMLAYERRRQMTGFDPLNAFGTGHHGAYQGVPLGGIGAGSIGRGWRGDFRRWQVRPGIYQQRVVWADQFALFVQRPGGPARAQVLFPGHPDDGTLSAWQWDMPADCAAYHALFPRAWTVYREPLPGIRLACRQLSPVIAHNYRESSLPTAEFRWRIENSGSDAATVGLMFTFQNGDGSDNDRAGGHANRPFRLDGPVVGVELCHIHRQRQAFGAGKQPAAPVVFEDPANLAIAARAGDGVEVSYRARFDPAGDGAEVWSDFAQDGRLDDVADDSPALPGQAIAAALAVTVPVPAGESREVSIALSWDMPRVRSGLGTRYLRRYTLFYGREGNAAPAIAADTLAQADSWEAQVAAWQRPIAGDATLPPWYRMALFNELYYLVEGGTLWVYPEESAPTEEDMGHFAYLEGHDYRMYNTYDVHFYASFALAMNWPRLELALQRDVAAATLVEYPDEFLTVYSGRRGRRKVRGAVPHDLGWPDEDPWKRVNGYFFHDTSRWKDLNCKLVLQVYRDYIVTGERAFLQEVWPAVEEAIAHVGRFDRDGDGLIENDGFPDQTYDTWTVRGPSAYCGGLWLAALQAAAEMAAVLGRPELAGRYRALCARGQAAYEDKLWNGRYYDYDASRSRQHDSIMADQLAGQWYARACGLPGIVPPEHARRALQTVYEYNVGRLRGGTMGAINGMRPDGRVDRSNLQSQEVWIGTTYALAAAMLEEGLGEESWRTAEGVVRSTYETLGYWFQTPEAWDERGDFRAASYMRPLAIWALQWALERGRPEGGPPR